MIERKQGIVVKILKERKGYIDILVDISGDIQKAICYPELTGYVEVGDCVVLNTTAVSLNLGTGGRHFVMAVKNGQDYCINDLPGHIMKLRYTPMQLRVMAAEEENSPYHDSIKEFFSLSGMPVIIGSLHSMIPTVFAGLKELFSDNINLAYIMTDGGALPINLSQIVYTLLDKGLIDKTITYGHAFGGDFECVNIYSALATAKEVIKADAVVIAMGPGIVGTGTPLGFTGIEQAHIIDAVNTLGGHPFTIPRISFSDHRSRHYGVSHHTLTILGKIVNTPTTVAIPNLCEEHRSYVYTQLKEDKIFDKHNVIFKDGQGGIERLNRECIRISTMGRTMQEDEEYFLAGGASAMAVYEYILSSTVKKGGED